jgi:hypothetical protein
MNLGSGTAFAYARVLPPYAVCLTVEPQSRGRQAREPPH